jgi:O-antigen/teichoic acid export membrane protein
MSRLRQSQGFRGGVILTLATIALNGSAYLYNVACIRYLGSRRYGDVAALLALGALVALPLGSVQIILAREAAQLGSVGAAARLLRRMTRGAVILGGALTALGLALVVPIQDVLNVESRIAVVTGMSGLLFAVVAAALYGILQGRLRFNDLGAIYAVSGASRVVLVVPALLLGLGAAGALAVNAVAGALAVCLATVALRDLWRVHEPGEPTHFDRREVGIMLVGSLAFASLTNADVLLAAYFLPDDTAGVYAAAALVGKVVLFLPAAIVTVLLPKAAVRSAAGFSPSKILLASAGVTLAATLMATALLAAVPEDLLVWAFGGDFRESTALLGWFGLAMTAAALVNVYLAVYFAERDARFPLLVVGAAIAQIVVVSLWHPGPRSIVLVTLMCAGTVLLIHELAFKYSLARVLRSSRTPIGASTKAAS